MRVVIKLVMARRQGAGAAAIAALGVALALVTAGCAGGTSDSAGPAHEPARVSTITLAHASSVPGLFRRLGLRRVFALPSGWSVDDTAASASGHWLAFSVYRTRGSGDPMQREDTWVTNTTTGRTRRFPQINTGWYAGTSAVIGNWLLRQEQQQLGNSDARRWRLYAQPIASDRPILLAQSNGMVSISAVPTLPAIARADTAFWVEGTTATRYALEMWRPGQRHPHTLATLDHQADPFADAHRIYLDQYLALAGNGEPPVAVSRLASDGSVHTLVTVSSSAEPVVTGSRHLVYFPYPGDGQGRWMLRPLTTSGRAHPIGTSILGAYAAVPLNDHQFLSWGSDEYDVLDINTGHQTNVQRGTTNVTVPRTTGTMMSVGVNQPKQIAVVGEGKPRLRAS